MPTSSEWFCSVRRSIALWELRFSTRWLRKRSIPSLARRVARPRGRVQGQHGR